MPCANMDARLRYDPTAGGGRVNQMAVILRQRPSSPDRGDKSGFEKNEAGSMVMRQIQEGKSW